MNVKTEETHVAKGCQVKRESKYTQIVTLGQNGCPCGARFDFSLLHALGERWGEQV